MNIYLFMHLRKYCILPAVNLFFANRRLRVVTVHCRSFSSLW